MSVYVYWNGTHNSPAFKFHFHRSLSQYFLLCASGEVTGKIIIVSELTVFEVMSVSVYIFGDL